MTDNIITRKANLEEFTTTLPELAYRAYSNRFFKKTTIEQNCNFILTREKLTLPPNTSTKELLEYSGSLSIPYSCLEPQLDGSGQSLKSFKRYWFEKIDDPNFRVFVAEINKNIIGFVKGSFEYIDCDKDFPEIEFLQEKNKIISLGSLYIDPDYRKGGVGTKLVKTYIQEALEEKGEYNGFITDCYWRNNSQYFFNKLGAVSIGFCNIPDIYLDKNLTRQTQNIVGEVMFWDENAINNLLKTDVINKSKILAQEEYTRNTMEYSLMTAALGNLEEYINIKSLNLQY